MRATRPPLRRLALALFATLLLAPLASTTPLPDVSILQGFISDRVGRWAMSAAAAVQLGPRSDSPAIDGRVTDVADRTLRESGGAGGEYGASTEEGTSVPTPKGGGWLRRWLAIGGEGRVIVHLDGGNLTLPHRPAAFPAHLSSDFSLPLSGYLTAFTSLPPHPSTSSYSPSLASVSGVGVGAVGTPIQACLPAPAFPARHHLAKPFTLALVERGACDFATKVLAAQERGAAGVVVGDTIAREGEGEEEGRKRDGLITMFSPEDTDDIYIPSVFVSRASFLLLMDLLSNGTMSRAGGQHGLWVELSPGDSEGGALGGLLSFALLMPSVFLLLSIAFHRIRAARQRELDRAPPLVVLSLPERVWHPDIVWEKDDDSSSPSTTHPSSPNRSRDRQGSRSVVDADKTPTGTPQRSRSGTVSTGVPISGARTALTPTLERGDPFASSSGSSHYATPMTSHRALEPSSYDSSSSADPRSTVSPSKISPGATGGRQSGKAKKPGKRYFSKDECAICMDEFHAGEIVRILPCGHVFHKEECDEWLLKWRKLCPTCRADVTLPPEGNFRGSTITPVTQPPEVVAGGVETGTRGDDGLMMRVRYTLDRFRQNLFRGRWPAPQRVVGQADHGADDERTPLVGRGGDVEV